MTPRHHPAPELLVDYAAGALPEGQALAVATHVEGCPDCRREVARLEALGGALLEGLAGAALAPDALATVLARLDDDPEDRPALGRAGSRLVAGVPAALAAYLDRPLEALPWRRVVRGIDEVVLPRLAGTEKVALMRIRAGVAVPQHTHHGTELTQVLVGGFSDMRGAFEAGDFVENDTAIDHRPQAHADADCICLAVTTAPLRLTGPIGRWLNPFVRL